jgi:hypothetical protein
VIGTGIVGWENWSEDNKPTRGPMKSKPRIAPNPQKPLLEFTAFVIWNYDLQRTQVWQFKQKRVKKDLEDMEKAKGDLYEYDILITRFGKDKDTKYLLKGLPNSPIPKDAIEFLEIMPVNLCALYVGKEPFVDMDAGKEVISESNVA